MKKIVVLMLIAIISMVVPGCGKNNSSSVEVAVAILQNEKTNSHEEFAQKLNMEKDIYKVTYQSGESYTDSSGMVWANVIWEVTNIGTETLYLGPTSIDITDNNGELIDSMKLVSACPEIISPGEKGYYYQSSRLDESTEELDIVPVVNATKAKVSKILLEASGVKIYDDKEMGVKVRGIAENTTNETQNMVTIAVVLFDENDKPAHVLSTMLFEELPAGGRIEFEAGSLSITDEFTSENVTRYEVYIYPQQFQF